MTSQTESVSGSPVPVPTEEITGQDSDILRTYNRRAWGLLASNGKDE